MGTELRMVPPNWEHPKKDFGGRLDFKPMYDKQYSVAAREWIDGFREWHANKYENKDCAYFWEYEGNPPKEEMYRTYSDEEATWYQIYETVSEGTPLSPPFATKEELVNYLVENGDFWQQSYKDGRKYSRAAAETLVKQGWAPSFVISDGKMYEGAEALAIINSTPNQ